LLLRGFDAFAEDPTRPNDSVRSQLRRSVYTILPLRCQPMSYYAGLSESETVQEGVLRDAWYSEKLSQTGMQKIRVSARTGETCTAATVIGLATCMILEKESDAYKAAGPTGKKDNARNPAKDVPGNSHQVKKGPVCRLVVSWQSRLFSPGGLYAWDFGFAFTIVQSRLASRARVSRTQIYTYANTNTRTHA
jgi:hypothetical protein